MSKVQSRHLEKPAYVYVRQSTMGQVRHHHESTERQYALRNRAVEMMWAPERIRILDQDLEGCDLSGEIPVELGNVEGLRRLNLAGNRLGGEVPAELGNLGSLVWLQLGGNRLSGAVPAELGNLESLDSIDLGGNRLTGTIPRASSGI